MSDGPDTSNYVWLAMTQNGWAKGETEDGALQKLRGFMGRRHVSEYGYRTYRVHPDFAIDEVDGSIRTPRGHPTIRVTDRVKL